MKRKDAQLHIVNAIRERTESNEKIETQKLEVKDRVDISLKEYIDLKQHIGVLEGTLDFYRKQFDKFPKPVLEIINNNEIDNVTIYQDPRDFNYYIKIFVKKRW